MNQRGSLFALSYEPHAGCFFNGDDPIDLVRRIPKLLAFRADAREPPPALADLDPFSCNLRLQALSSASHAELSAIFRLVPDQVHIIALAPDALSAKAEGRGHEASAKELVRLVIEEQIQLVSLAKDHPNYIRSSWFRHPSSGQRPAPHPPRRSGRTSRARRCGSDLPVESDTTSNCPRRYTALTTRSANLRSRRKRDRSIKPGRLAAGALACCG